MSSFATDLSALGPRARDFLRRSANLTQSAAILNATGGNEAQAIQAVETIGYQRVQGLVEGGTLKELTQILSTPQLASTLQTAATGSAEQTAAFAKLRAAATTYDAQDKLTEAAQSRTATVGTPTELPAAATPPATPKMNPLATALFLKDTLRQIGNHKVDRALDRFVYSPWEQYVANPTAEGAVRMYERFAQTPAGRVFDAQIRKVPGAVEAVIGQGTPLGKVLQGFDQAIVKNEKLWDTVDKAGAFGRKIVVGAAGTTAALIANASQNGTLQTGTFNTSGKLTPAQLQMVKGINIPPNMNVRYYTVPSVTPVTVKGQTFNVKGAATIVVAEGSNVLFLPALGPGKPGAQPWFGGVPDLGPRRDEKGIVAASSSVAAAKWNVMGFSLGTSNFNVGGRADVQIGRGLLNILAIQGKRLDQPAGMPRVSAQSILIADPVSTFHSASFNMGPLAVVVDRVRYPQSEKLTVPNGRNSVTLFGEPHASSVQPAIPFLGASTWDPSQDDIRLLNAWFGQLGGGSAKP